MSLHFTKLCVLTSIAFLFFSCDFNGTYTNREEDKEEAEKTTTQFYQLLKERKFEETYKLFSPRFLAVTSESQLSDIYNISTEKFGDVKKVKVEKWTTQIIKGEKPFSNYAFIFKVSRTKFSTDEIIRLEKEGEKIVIAYYDIHYDDKKVK